MAKSKANESDFLISETGNWNVADQYSKIKIMKPLEFCDIYEDIANYGYDSLLEELVYVKAPTDELRYRGLNRLVNELLKLSQNCQFAMKKEGTLSQMKEIEKTLQKIRDYFLPLTYTKKINQALGTSEIKLKKEIFEKIFDKVKELKIQINYPLNKNHLIFTDKQEFDPIAYKDRLKKRIVEQG